MDSLPPGTNRKGEGGSRQKEIFKHSIDTKPLISIITIAYNSGKFIEETIESVINQTYDNVEYIIIDGGSTDGSLDIIKKYEDKIDYWISEKDSGIYDAMNKGIALAKGDWINFMNTSDKFYSNDTIKNAINVMTDKEVNYYGDTVYANKLSTYVFNSKIEQKSNFLNHNTFSHQAIFYSLRSVINTGFYNTKIKISSDFDFTYRVFLNHKFIKINEIISYCLLDGVSGTQAVQSFKDRMHTFWASKSYLYHFLLSLYFPFFYLKALLIKKLNNTSILKIYRQYKYKAVQ